MISVSVPKMAVTLAENCKMPDRPGRPIERIAIAADDSHVIREGVRFALKSSWQVFTATNGKEALEFARTVRAGFVLLDARMPRMDGIEACRQIRGLPHYATVPIVILTAYDDPPLRRHARQAGVSRIVPKPFTQQGLRAQIDELLALRAHDAPIDADPGHPPAGSRKLDDREVLEICRRVEAAADDRAYTSFSEVMQALHDSDRY